MEQVRCVSRAAVAPSAEGRARLLSLSPASSSPEESLMRPVYIVAMQGPLKRKSLRWRSGENGPTKPEWPILKTVNKRDRHKKRARRSQPAVTRFADCARGRSQCFGSGPGRPGLFLISVTAARGLTAMPCILLPLSSWTLSCTRRPSCSEYLERIP